MLRNELKEIEKLLADRAGVSDINHSVTGFHELVILIQEAWLNAVFSEQPKSSLGRYLQFHLEGISKISDTLFGLGSDDTNQMQEELLSLIDHLRDFYHHLVSWDAVTPFAYHQSYLNRLNPILTAFRFDLDRSNVDGLLKNVIRLWLDEMSVIRDSVRYTFDSLYYMGKLLRTFAAQDWEAEHISDSLTAVLCHFNFNHLSFLKYLQSNISKVASGFASQKEVLLYLQLKEAEFSSIPMERNCSFDNSWPTIKVMMTDWLKEQVKVSEMAVRKEQDNLNSLYSDKLGMRISVSYMACLIKLFYEEELFATENLTSIFKFYASNFTSKRQPVISQESLSKEYYSLDAHTAARIKKILQNMIDRLNRGFFP